MAIQFERKFVNNAREAARYVDEILHRGGNWQFEMEAAFDDDEDFIGYWITAEPFCSRWEKLVTNKWNEIDGYECCIPVGTEKDTVEGWEAECLSAFSVEDNE